MFLFVIRLMMASLRAETCSEWYVIINTRWKVVAKEGLVIPILFNYVHWPYLKTSSAFSFTCLVAPLNLLVNYYNSPQIFGQRFQSKPMR
jgi:hypothetical protein